MKKGSRGKFNPATPTSTMRPLVLQAGWTAQRNMRAVLETMEAGRLPVERLTTHSFPIERAPEAYDLITSRREPFLGIVIDYPPSARPQRRINLRAEAPALAGTTLGISMIGAGNFARLVILPALSKRGGIEWRGLCTARGMSAEDSGRRQGFAFATTDVAEVWRDETTRAVFIMTRHDLHAELVVAALRAGKHVFVEKPLCIKPEELQQVAECVEELGEQCPVLMVGFNRRFAPATARLRQHFTEAHPLSIGYRFAPGSLPANAWPQDEEVSGGRIIGEACHAIDICIALTGSEPVRVFAESVGQVNGQATSDDSLFITMRHRDGSISNVSYQAGGDRAAPVERITVDGGGRTGFVEAWKKIELWKGNRRVSASGGKDKGHAAELDAFVEVCRSGGAWPIPWPELYATAWASMAAVRSLREGLPIEYDGDVF